VNPAPAALDRPATTRRVLPSARVLLGAFTVLTDRSFAWTIVPIAWIFVALAAGVVATGAAGWRAAPSAVGRHGA
jgi:hypothetical protein